jgi:hypothetical protein
VAAHWSTLVRVKVGLVAEVLYLVLSHFPWTVTTKSAEFLPLHFWRLVYVKDHVESLVGLNAPLLKD